MIIVGLVNDRFFIKLDLEYLQITIILIGAAWYLEKVEIFNPNTNKM